MSLFRFVVLILFTGLCNLFYICEIQAQAELDISKRLLNIEDQILLEYFHNKGHVSNSANFSKSRILGKLNNISSLLQSKNEITNSLVYNGIDFRASHVVSIGQNINALNSNNLPHYSLFGANANLSLLNLPFQIGGDLILINGSVDSRLSTMSVSFDTRQYLNKLKKQYLPVNQPADFFRLEDNPLNLNAAESNILKEEFLFTLYKEIIGSLEFREYATDKLISNDSLLTEISSLLLKADSLGELSSKDQIDQYKNELANNLYENLDLNLDKGLIEQKIYSFEDSTLQKVKNLYESVQEISNEVQKINALKKKYNESWQNVKNRDKIIVESLYEKLDSYTSRFNELQKPETFKKYVKKEHSLNSIDNILLFTKAFDIGFFALERSDHLSNYLTLNGLRYSYDDSKVYGEVAYGKQSLSNQFSPVLGTFLTNKYFGRNVLYGNVGVRSLNGILKTDFSILQINENASSVDSIQNLPKRNVVFGWSGQMDISSDLSLQAKIAISDLDNGLPVVGDDNVTEDDVSVSVLAIQEGSSKFQVEAGYFYNGKNYVSLANPFLLTNRQGLNFVSRLKLLDNKLILNGDLKLSKNIDKETTSPFKDLQFLGDISYRFGQFNSVTFRLVPNLFVQEVSQNLITANNNIYSLQANLTSKVKSNQLLSVINFTNLRTDIQLIDTVSLDARNYLYVQEIFMMSNGNSINLAVMAGNNKLKFRSFTDFLLQLDGSVQMGKMKFTLGAQVIKQHFSLDIQYGIINRLHLSVFDKCTLSFNSIYRRSFDSTVSNLQANLSVIYSMSYEQRKKSI